MERVVKKSRHNARCSDAETEKMLVKPVKKFQIYLKFLLPSLNSIIIIQASHKNPRTVWINKTTRRELLNACEVGIAFCKAAK